MKILIDMNLTPRWVEFLCSVGHQAAHWSAIGRISAPDRESSLTRKEANPAWFFSAASHWSRSPRGIAVARCLLDCEADLSRGAVVVAGLVGSTSCQSAPPDLNRPPSLSQNIFDYVAGHIRQAEVAAAVAVSQPGVVQPE